MATRRYTLTSSDITGRVGISLRQLYYWELKGVIRPKVEQIGRRNFKRYSEEDLRVLREIKKLLDDGYTLETAMRKARGG